MPRHNTQSLPQLGRSILALSLIYVVKYVGS